MEEDSGKSGNYHPSVDGSGSRSAVPWLIAWAVIFVALSVFMMVGGILKFDGFIGSTVGGIALVGGAFAFAAILHLWRK